MIVEIKNLKPGPLLDALVSKYVAGHDVLGVAWCRNDPEGPWFNVDSDQSNENRRTTGALWSKRLGVFLLHCNCDLYDEPDEEELEMQEEFGSEFLYGDKIYGHYWTDLEACPNYSHDMSTVWKLVVESQLLYDKTLSEEGGHGRFAVLDKKYSRIVVDGDTAEDVLCKSLLIKSINSTQIEIPENLKELVVSENLNMK